jgi:hypothetical protein
MKMIISLFFFVSIVVIAISTGVEDMNPHRIFRSNALLQRSLQSQSSFSTAIAKLTASNGGADLRFHKVAISKNRILVGANGYDSFRGAAYLFGDPSNPQSGHSYSQLALLTASDGESSDWFGYSVAMNGDIIVVGAYGYSNYTGASYVYRIITDDNNNNNNNNNVVSISQLAKITASNGVDGDMFGWSVAIHGNYILVGATWVNSNVGSTYFFGNPSIDPNSPAWTELQLIQPNDLTEYDSFGYSVAMEDNIAIIGADGADATYVFAPVYSSSSSSLLSTSWTQMAKLTGLGGSYFGSSVAVAGNWIAVGALLNDKNSNGIYMGAVFVFTKTSSSLSWTQMTQLLPADSKELDYFGSSVSISKDASTIVVGATDVDINSTIYSSGAAYMFRAIKSTTTTTTVQWTQMGKFVAADPDTDDFLGSSIAIENNIVVVGAWVDDSFTGSVYVVDTGFSSSTPATTAPPITTPVTPEPTLGRTFNPTIPPSLDNNSSSTPPQPLTNSPASTVPLLPPTTTSTPSSSNIDTDPTNSPIPNNPTTQPIPECRVSYVSYMSCLSLHVFVLISCSD